MSKRELAFVAANAEVEPRSKRRKATEEEDVSMGDDTTPTKISSAGGSGLGGLVNGATKEEVQEQGNALWLAVKDAVNKECVNGQASCVCSYFLPCLLRLPTYLDYP